MKTETKSKTGPVTVCDGPGCFSGAKVSVRKVVDPDGRENPDADHERPVGAVESIPGFLSVLREGNLLIIISVPFSVVYG